MLGKQTGQKGFGNLETMGQVPEGHFLLKIDGQINWRPFERLMAPLYHPTQGRPSHPPLVMFKALLLQQWYALSDPGLEEAICDRLSFRRFLGLSLSDPSRMKPGFAGFATCWPRKTWGSTCLPCWRSNSRPRG